MCVYCVYLLCIYKHIHVCVCVCVCVCIYVYMYIYIYIYIRGGNLLESLDSIRIDSWGHDSIKNRFTIVSIHDSKTILQFESNFDFIYIIYLYFIPVCGLVFFCSYLTVMDSPKERKIPLHQKPEIYFVSFSCTLNNLVYIYIYKRKKNIFLQK